MEENVEIQIFGFMVKLVNDQGGYDYCLTIQICENGVKIRTLTGVICTARASN